ncbi:MAG: Rid family hydrolase [Rhodothermales bacterium]|nr:Rid family hydrolase [Rhodothermales bacterium]
MAQAREVARFGPFKDYIADGVRHGDTIYLSGQVSLNGEGDLVGAGALAAQVRQSYANVKEALSHFGATMDDVVDEMWLVTDMDAAMGSVDELFGIRADAYGKSPDVAQTMIRVAGLVMPELMIEIKCVARV